MHTPQLGAQGRHRLSIRNLRFNVSSLKNRRLITNLDRCPRSMLQMPSKRVFSYAVEKWMMKLASQAEEDASKARAAYDAAQEKVRLHQRMISARSVKGEEKIPNLGSRSLFHFSRTW